MKKISDKAVIFDLDGTLLYTLEDLSDSVNFALSKYNYPIRSLDEIRSFVGNGVRPLIERSIPNGSENPDFDEVLKTFKNNYSKNMYNKTRVFDGITELFNELKNEGYRIAVVSNKFDKAVKELCNKYFGQSVEIAIGESENVRKKPAPDSVYEVIKSLNVQNAVYVGDSEVDIQTAENAGLKCISVTWGYKNRDFLENHGAEYLAESPEDILKLLKVLL